MKKSRVIRSFSEIARKEIRLSWLSNRKKHASETKSTSPYFAHIRKDLYGTLSMHIYIFRRQWLLFSYVFGSIAVHFCLFYLSYLRLV